MANSPKHNTREYKRIKPIVRAAAYANPNTRCPHPDCGLTLAEKRRTNPNESWDCGHPEPDALTEAARTGYTAWHASCNRSHGPTKGNRNRNGNALGL